MQASIILLPCQHQLHQSPCTRTAKQANRRHCPPLLHNPLQIALSSSVLSDIMYMCSPTATQHVLVVVSCNINQSYISAYCFYDPQEATNSIWPARDTNSGNAARPRRHTTYRETKRKADRPRRHTTYRETKTQGLNAQVPGAKS